MTREEAIGYAMVACRDMWKGHVCKEIETLLIASSEAEKKYTSLLAEERYKDLCEFFGNDKYLIKTILGNRAEFNNWLERMRSNTIKVNELFEENEKLTALLLKQNKNYSFKEGVVLPYEHYENEDEMGHWIIERDPNTGKDMFYHCSKCYEDSGFTTTFASKFCPNCGKKMHRQPMEENINC